MANGEFDESNIPPVEKESINESSPNEEGSIENGPIIAKEAVVGVLKTNGLNPESIDLLLKFTDQVEQRLIDEGRVDAHIESLREKGHALNLAGLYAEAILVMEDVVEIAQNESDDESYKEALWIIERLESLNKKKQKEDRKKYESIEETKINLEAISGPQIPREEVLEAYRNLSQKVESPDDLNQDDPEVKLAERKYKIWMKQTEMEGKTDENFRLRNNFERTMLFVDAGFVGKNYLSDVLGWVYQDSADVEKDLNDPSKVELRSDMAKAMLRIRALLKM